MPNDHRRLGAARALLVAVLAPAVARPARAQRPAARAAADTAADTAAVAAFADRFFATLPDSERVPRAAFAYVMGGRVAVLRGYGRTAAGNPVDPTRTLFRAASNSKLVVAAAAVQLAAAGRWRLGDDVNRWLPPAARLDDAFGAPVTIAHLLTHTAGLEDSFADGLALRPQDRLTLAEYFARRRPRRVAPPGWEVSYSNAGMALAGYLVERASGEPFADYAERHVLAPLGMTRSTFAQPVPRAWWPDLAGGPPGRRGEVYWNPYPAASLVTTAADMGRFVAAQLRAPEGALLATHWRPAPAVPGVAYGFFEGEANGRRTRFHTGDAGDHSVVFLLPDEGVGLYLVYAGRDEQASLRERFVRELVDAFFAAPANVAPAAQPLPAPAELRAIARACAGTYRGAGYAVSTFEKVKALVYQVTVRDAGDGSLEVRPPGVGTPLRARPVAPYVFRAPDGGTLTFRRRAPNRSGARAPADGFTLTGSIWDPSSWDRVGPLEDGRVHLAAFGAALLMLAARAVVWPALSLARRVARRGRVAAPARAWPATARRAWRWSGVAAGLVALSPVAALATAFLSFQHPVIAVPRAVAVLSTGLAVGALLGAALAVPLARAWRAGALASLGRARAAHAALVAAASLLLVPLLWYWNLLGPHL